MSDVIPIKKPTMYYVGTDAIVSEWWVTKMIAEGPANEHDEEMLRDVLRDWLRLAPIVGTG